jgi:DNA-binding beta-propeller fold protein YncE
VACFEDQKVQKFTPSGDLLAEWAIGLPPWGLAVDESGNVHVASDAGRTVVEVPGTPVTVWGQPSGTLGIAVANGLVYLTDGSHRVYKLTLAGEPAKVWGALGSGEGQLSVPVGLDIDDAGSVYVAEQLNHRVQKFTGDGDFISVVVGPTLAALPQDVDLDPAGNIYVANTASNRIMKMDASGRFLTSWNGSEGGGQALHVPTAIVTDAMGNVYVADTGNNQVQKFGPATIDDPDDDDGDPPPPPPPPPPVDPVVGAITLFADRAGTRCNILDDGSSEVVSVYVIHTGTGCKTGSAFAAPIPACVDDAVFVTDVCPLGLCLGSSQTGVSIGYGDTYSGPIHVLTIQFIGSGRTPQCCHWPVVPEPYFGGLLYTGCDGEFSESTLPGVGAMVNPTAACECQVPSPPSQWTQIKAVLRTN